MVIPTPEHHLHRLNKKGMKISIKNFPDKQQKLYHTFSEERYEQELNEE